MAPQYFALPCLESPFMGKKPRLGKIQGFSWGKSHTCPKNQGFSVENSLAHKFIFDPPQSQNPTSLPGRD